MPLSEQSDEQLKDAASRLWVSLRHGSDVEFIAVIDELEKRLPADEFDLFCAEI